MIGQGRSGCPWCFELFVWWRVCTWRSSSSKLIRWGISSVGVWLQQHIIPMWRFPGSFPRMWHQALAALGLRHGEDNRRTAAGVCTCDRRCVLHFVPPAWDVKVGGVSNPLCGNSSSGVLFSQCCCSCWLSGSNANRPSLSWSGDLH